MTLLLSSLWVSAQAGQAGAEQKRVQAEGSLRAQRLEQMEVNVRHGAIRVYGDSPNTVRWKAVRIVESGSADERNRWLNEARVSVEQQGETLVIQDIVPKDLQRSRDGKLVARLEMEIHVSPELALEVTNGVGDIEVNGQLGDLVVKNGVGDVKLRQFRGSGRRLDIHTGVGDVQVGVRTLPARSLQVNVGVGNVRVGLAGQPRASVSMSAADLESDYPLASPQRGRMVGDINGGGTRIDVRVGKGDARLEKD